MKSAIRAGLMAAGRYEPVWHLFGWMNTLARVLAEPRYRSQLDRDHRQEVETALRLSPDLTVLHGPFAGLRYPVARAAGSALLPKILGSYERELHPVVEEVVASGYTDLVDVGCAEGYYAVGLGRLLANTQVHAFDTDPVARQLCADLAGANGVADRVHIRGLCDPQTLMDLPLGARALVISDCEGYEAELFTPDVAQRLARHDLLIEVHDRHDAALGPRLREVFAASHYCTVIDSIDDTRKLRTYHYAELAAFDLTTRRRLLSEGRGMVMEWLFLRARASVVA